MSKEYFVINAGRVVYAPGHYDIEDAKRIALNAAKRSPGKTFSVMHRVDVYRFKKEKQK